MNDSELVQGLRDQDPAAVRQLTDRYLPSIWRFVYFRVNGDSHLAEDIVSESVLALVRAVADETQIDNPVGWLRSVASHKVLDHFRAAARVQHLVNNVAQTADLVQSEDVVRRQEQLERRAEVREAMDELPDQHRLALEWKYIERWSVREIADRLEVTEKAAESILFRARRTLREKLQRKTIDQDSPGPFGAARPPDNGLSNDNALSNNGPSENGLNEQGLNEQGLKEFRPAQVGVLQTPGS